jgi:hypothetical protein
VSVSLGYDEGSLPRRHEDAKVRTFRFAKLVLPRLGGAVLHASVIFGDSGNNRNAARVCDAARARCGAVVAMPPVRDVAP